MQHGPVRCGMGRARGDHHTCARCMYRTAHRRHLGEDDFSGEGDFDPLGSASFVEGEPPAEADAVKMGVENAHFPASPPESVRPAAASPHFEPTFCSKKRTRSGTSSLAARSLSRRSSALGHARKHVPAIGTVHTAWRAVAQR